MNTAVVLEIIGAVVVSGAAALVFGRTPGDRKLARARLTEAPPLTADSLDGSVVRVTGIVRRDAEAGVVTSPLSETRCVAHRTRAWVVGRIGVATSRPYETLRLLRFVIDRGDDPAVTIEGAYALFDLPAAKISRYAGSRRLQFLRDHGLMMLRSNYAAFEELAVEPGQTVTIAGTLVMAAGSPATGERGYREGARVTLALVGDREHPLVIGTPR